MQRSVWVKSNGVSARDPLTLTVIAAGLLTVVAVLLTAGCGTSAVAPGWQASFGYADESLHRFEIRDLRFPFVPVQVERETVWLPFDTGNMVGLHLETAVFRDLSLPCSDQWDRLDSAGQKISSGCIARGTQVTAFGQRNEAASVYEFTHDILPGMVGPDMLPGSRFTMDYERRLMAVDDGTSSVELPGFAALPLVRSGQFPRLILVHATVRGRDVLVEIDTGKSRTTVDRELAAELELEPLPRGVRVGALQLGPRSFTVGSGRIVNTSAISEGLSAPISLGVGSDLLAQFVFTVDYRAGLLWIQEPQ